MTDAETPPVYNPIIDAIDRWEPVEGPLRWSDARFMELVRPIFAHQFEHNDPYRQFCRREDVEPGALEGPETIPAVSTEVFKHADLSCDGPIERTFRTSGTTGERRGEHHFRTLAAYRASLDPPFRRFCNPDGESLRMLVVAQSPEVAPDSSLSFMLGELMDRWGDPASAFFVGSADASSERAGDGQAFRFDALADALDRAVADGATVMLLGTAFGFAEFFERLPEGRRWELPGGSRLMETGGFKGKERELTREGLYAAFERRLGVGGQRCLGEYSMTELSSQAYTKFGDAGGDQAFYTPPWARILLVDPVSLEPFEESGRRGLIRWVDLANVGSVMAVQTGDMGRRTEDGGLVLEGRAPGAQLRGCSLTVEELARVGSGE